MTPKEEEEEGGRGGEERRRSIMIRIRGGYGNVYGRRRVGSGGIFVDFVYACHRHGGARRRI